MKARTINRAVWAVIALALSANTLFDGWDGFATAGNIAGYAIICTALCIAINSKIKEE